MDDKTDRNVTISHVVMHEILETDRLIHVTTDQRRLHLWLAVYTLETII